MFLFKCFSMPFSVNLIFDVLDFILRSCIALTLCQRFVKKLASRAAIKPNFKIAPIFTSSVPGYLLLFLVLIMFLRFLKCSDNFKLL